jgi:hypothetical protein
MKNKFTPGQTVWVSHFSVDRYKPEPARAVVRSREFYRESVSNLSCSKGQPRLIVGPHGKASFEGGSAPYGMAYAPESVYATEAEAKGALVGKIDALLEKLVAMKSRYSDLTA